MITAPMHLETNKSRYLYHMRKVNITDIDMDDQYNMDMEDDDENEDINSYSTEFYI